MKLRDLVEKDILFLEDIEEICFEGCRYFKDLERFLDYKISYITPCTSESLAIGVEK